MGRLDWAQASGYGDGKGARIIFITVKCRDGGRVPDPLLTKTTGVKFALQNVQVQAKHTNKHQTLKLTVSSLGSGSGK